MGRCAVAGACRTLHQIDHARLLHSLHHLRGPAGYVADHDDGHVPLLVSSRVRRHSVAALHRHLKGAHPPVGLAPLGELEHVLSAPRLQHWLDRALPSEPSRVRRWHRPRGRHRHRNAGDPPERQCPDRSGRAPQPAPAGGPQWPAGVVVEIVEQLLHTGTVRGPRTQSMRPARSITCWRTCRGRRPADPPETSLCGSARRRRSSA